jgi:hypothetical protein
MLSKSRLNSGFQRAKALHFSLVSSVLSHTFCRLMTASFCGTPLRAIGFLADCRKQLTALLAYPCRNALE